MSVEHTESVKRVLSRRVKKAKSRPSSMTHQYKNKKCTEKRYNAIQKFLNK